MTDKPMTAKEYLSQYKIAMLRCDYLKHRVDVMRERAEGVRSPSDIPSGLTGKTCAEKSEKGSSLSIPERVPYISHARDPKGGERALWNLAFESIDHKQAVEEADKIYREIDTAICSKLDGLERAVLLERFLKFKTFKQIAHSLGVSNRHAYRLYNDAMDRFASTFANDE